MAVTISITNVMSYIMPILKNQRLLISNQQPLLTQANQVLQGLLQPPLRYRFNRKNIAIDLTVLGGTDYDVSIPDLGWIETQWIADETGAASVYYSCDGGVSIPKTSTAKRPQAIAPVYDDNAGNIVFRVDSTPDQAYVAYVDYQAKAQPITSVAGTFGPFPDEFGFLFTKWMLSECSLIVNDPRFQIFRREAVYATLATQDGLNEQARVRMIEQMVNFGLTAGRSNATAQEAVKLRVGP